MIRLPAASVTASIFRPEGSSSTTMVCTLPAASVTGMAACWPGAVNRTVCAPGETALYDVAAPKASPVFRRCEYVTFLQSDRVLILRRFIVTFRI